MLETRHHWLCVILAIYFPVACFISYGIAVANKNVEPAWPYISDTGAVPPESCVFGQFLNIGAIIAGVIIYIRYRHIHHHLHDLPGKLGLLRFNTVTFFVGMTTALGISLAGNFQGYPVHVVATVAEWLVAFVSVIYFATFYTEFKHFRMRPTAVEYYKQSVTNGTQPKRGILGSSDDGQRLNVNPAKNRKPRKTHEKKSIDDPITVTMETETVR